MQRIENLAENLAIEKREKIKNPDGRWKKITTKKISRMKSPPKRGRDLKIMLTCKVDLQLPQRSK